LNRKFLQATVFAASISFITYFVVTDRMTAQNDSATESREDPVPTPTEQIPVDPEQPSTPEPEAVPPEY